MTSSIHPSLPALTPTYPPNRPNASAEKPSTQALIAHLNLQPHIEGGYFVETDRDTRRVANPFIAQGDQTSADTRAASTSIFYLLTEKSSLGAFHVNRGRTVHTLHKGRGRYVLIHEEGRVETFIVGHDILNGERLQWIVEGGVWKASFLLPDVNVDASEDSGREGSGQGEETGEGEGSEGLLISETVVPGFEYEDHAFMAEGVLEGLVGVERAGEMRWMVRKT